MAQLVFANLVAETATAAGTGAFALQGAVSTQYSSFSGKIQIGSNVVYTARQGALFEVGYGVLTSSTQLTRVGVYDSSAASGYVNSVTPGSPGFVTFDSAQTLTVYNDVPAQLFLALNTDGSLASPTPLRKAIIIDTNTQMKALATYADGESVFVTGFGDASGIQPGLFRFNAGVSTAPDGVDTFRNNNSSTGLYQRQKLVIQGNFQGTATFDAATSGGGFTSKEFANPSTSNANDYFARIVDASAGAWRWASRLNQSGVKNFLNLFSPGNAQDRIEAAVPMVQASVSDATGLKARTLTWLSGVSRLAFARVDAANATTATDYREIPLTKGGYIVASVKDIYDLKQIDPTSAGSGFADYDMAQTRGLNTASSDSGHTLTGSVAPVFWYWLSTSTLTEDLVNVVRPSVGSAASGNGRWIREVSDITAGGTFTSGVATPSVKNGQFFITAGTTSITNFLNGYEGQRIIIQRGSADITITHNGTSIDLGGTNVTLTTTNPRIELINQSGIWRSIGLSFAQIANGGTGASTATGALTNFGLLGSPNATLAFADVGTNFAPTATGDQLAVRAGSTATPTTQIDPVAYVQYVEGVNTSTQIRRPQYNVHIRGTASTAFGQSFYQYTEVNCTDPTIQTVALSATINQVGPGQSWAVYGNAASRQNNAQILGAEFDVTNGSSLIATLTTTATTSSGSPTLTAVSNTLGLAVGAYVVAAGVPAGTQVVSFTSNTVTMNANATASATVSTVFAGMDYIYNPVNPALGLTLATTGNTNGTTTISGLASTMGVVVGNQVQGSGIPNGAYVTAINSATSVTISAAATTSVTGNALKFYGGSSKGCWVYGLAGNKNTMGYGLGAAAANGQFQVGFYVAPYACGQMVMDIQASPSTLIYFRNGAGYDTNGAYGGVGIDFGTNGYGSGVGQGCINFNSHKRLIGPNVSQDATNGGKSYWAFDAVNYQDDLVINGIVALKFGGSALVSNADNTYSLGASGNRWANIYTASITATGVSAGTVNATGAYYVNSLQVLGPRQTGWSGPTATPSRAALSGTATLAQVTSALAALINDLLNTGIIGA